MPDQGAAPLARFPRQPIDPQRSIAACGAAGGGTLRSVFIGFKKPFGEVNEASHLWHFADGDPWVYPAKKAQLVAVNVANSSQIALV